MIDLYYWPTPNGHKITLMLEELAEAGAKLDYRIIPVDIGKGDQFKPEYLVFSPNNKMPAIIDHAPADGGEPISVFESGAILLYLANKTGRFFGTDTRQKVAVNQWLMWQMGGLGPMFGQLGFFHKFAGKDYEDKRPRDRYVAESKRLLGVLNQRLTGRQWVMGDQYTIADIAILPWVRNLVGFYGASDLVKFGQFTELQRVLDVFVARPAVAKGLNIPARG